MALLCASQEHLDSWQMTRLQGDRHSHPFEGSLLVISPVSVSWKLFFLAWFAPFANTGEPHHRPWQQQFVTTGMQLSSLKQGWKTMENIKQPNESTDQKLQIRKGVCFACFLAHSPFAIQWPVCPLPLLDDPIFWYVLCNLTLPNSNWNPVEGSVQIRKTCAINYAVIYCWLL